jgi:hypothetical protein
MSRLLMAIEAWEMNIFIFTYIIIYNYIYIHTYVNNI